MPVADLPYEKVESIIQEISSGGRLVSVLTSSGESVNVFITHCVGPDLLRASLVYEEAYKKAVADGFLTREETRKLLQEKGVVDTSIDIKIEQLKAKIEGQETYLSKLTKVPSRRQKTIDNINALKEQLESLYFKKDEGLEYSAERAASESRYLYMAWLATKKEDCVTQYWETIEDFNNETDVIFRRNVFLKVIELHGGLDVSLLRYIARHNLWRIRYIASIKTGESLFGVPIRDYTVDQLGLVYWSNFYQSVYDMLPEHRPSNSIIEDDAALDAYMKAYMEEMDREATAAREKAGKGKGSSAWDKGEVLIMRSNPIYDDVEYSETIESAREKLSSSIKVKKK